MKLEQELFNNGFYDFLPSDSGDQWTLTAAGDMAVIRAIKTTVDEQGFEALCETVKPLTTADLSIVNLETALPNQGEEPSSGVWSLRSYFRELRKHLPFALYSMANNHILDAGQKVLVDTLDEFDKNGIDYVGAGRNRTEAETPKFFDVKGVRIGVLAFAQDEHQIAGTDKAGAAHLQENKVLQLAESLANNCDVPIIIMHEGFEMMNVPRLDFMRLCRKLPQLGVKLVIAHHSHVPQGIERVDQSLIFYSLGNFIFSMPHLEKYEWTSKSYIPRVTFSGTEIQNLKLQPFVADTSPFFKVRPANVTESEYILNHLKSISDTLSDPEKMNKAIDDFVTTILLPEYFGFVRHTGNENNGDFASYIENIKTLETVHKLFKDFLDLYSNKG